MKTEDELQLDFKVYTHVLNASNFKLNSTNKAITTGNQFTRKDLYISIQYENKGEL